MNTVIFVCADTSYGTSIPCVKINPSDDYLKTYIARFCKTYEEMMTKFNELKEETYLEFDDGETYMCLTPENDDYTERDKNRILGSLDK